MVTKQSIWCLFMFATESLMATAQQQLPNTQGTVRQRQVIVADAETHKPVAQASLYTKEGERFRSVTTDDNGQAVIRFKFSRLTISHLNYERRTLTHLTDTIWLKPRWLATKEVIVTNEEPAWIRQKLRQLVKEKRCHYLAKADTMNYRYKTQNIGNSSYYHYESTGRLALPAANSKRFAIKQLQGIITSSDSTRLTDMQTMRRMLYEDIVSELDGEFIRQHHFSENGEYTGASPNEIELVFRAKHHQDDRGRLVIDTARYIILKASRTTGTKTNIRRRTSMALLGMARIMSGYRITKWVVNQGVEYTEYNGWYYPARMHYKLVFEGEDHETDKDEIAYHKQTGGGFSNMEGSMELTPNIDNNFQSSPEVPFLMLPGSWYLRLSSESQRRQEIELSNLPAEFRLF